MTHDGSQDFLDDLIELLSSIPALDDYDSRTALLRGLPQGPVSAIRRDSALLLDLTTIVETVAKWGRMRSGEYALKIVIRNAGKFVEGLALGDRLAELEQQFYDVLPTAPSRVPFTNREDEIQLMLSSFAPAYYLLDAPAGYGKTDLLKELEQRFLERNWHCAYASVNENSTLAGLVDTLAEKLNVSLIRNPQLPLGRRLGGALKTQWGAVSRDGLILLIDLEKRPALVIVKELLDELIPAISESLYTLELFKERRNRFRVIFAGRCLAASTEVRTSELPLKILQLTPFEYEVIQQSARGYLEGHEEGSIRQLAAHLLHLSGGHPSCVVQVLEMYGEMGLPPDDFLEYYGQDIWEKVVRKVVDDIYSHVPENLRVNQTLDRLSVIRYLDHMIFKNIIKEGEIPGVKDEYALEDELTATYLFARQGRLLKDDITRRLLAIRQWQVMPEEFSTRCQQAQEMCADRMRDPQVQLPEIWLIEYLFQSLQQHVGDVQDAERRRVIRQVFLDEDVPRALEMFVQRVPSADRYQEQFALTQAMDNDWEFCFTVNYYLREDQYNDEPCQELRRRIVRFFSQQGEVGGEDA